MSHYQIRCRRCKKVLEQTYCAFCEHCVDSLLVTEYNEREFVERDGVDGIWRFNWLPVHSPATEEPGPVVYKSKGLAAHLGLNSLYIAFNGYWPERGANVKSCTFKHFEAAAVLHNAMENDIDGLVVASAGNTARAFAHLSELYDYPSIIVVPRMCLEEMWYLDKSTRVPTIVVGDGDYADAIDLAKRIALLSGKPFEGGIKNIAKRDGLGVVMLEAVSKMQKLPDHYFQAVGSGAGAIAVWEMSERFLGDGRFGNKLPQLHLAQNLPFAPMMHAWKRSERTLDPDDLKPELIGHISTRVLSTRYPAYSVQGGVYDALTASGGDMYGITNMEMSASRKLFEETEGIDIVPAAAVAVGALAQAVRHREISDKDVVLLNITGGGEAGIRAKGMAHQVSGELVSKTISDQEIERLFCEIPKKD